MTQLARKATAVTARRGTREDFNLERHRREKAARLERRVQHLETYRGQLEAVLALALRVAVRGTDVSPVTLLTVLEDLTDATTRGEAA